LLSEKNIDTETSIQLKTAIRKLDYEEKRFIKSYNRGK